MSWFPGGTKLLFSGQAAPGVYGIWTLAPASGDVRKLQDGVATAVPSPDGSSIAFIKRQQQEIWTMDPNGEKATRMLAAPRGQSLSQVGWSPDGRWLTYIRRTGQSEGGVFEGRLAGAEITTKIFDSPDLQGFCWLSPRRLVLNLWEAPEQPTSNLWEIDVDPKTMKPIDKPRRLTNWAGFAVGDMRASADGRRLVVVKRSDQSVITVGDLADYGQRLLHPRRFNTEKRIYWPGGWSPDSKWLLFQSDRTGRMGIFRQQLDSPNPEPVVANQEDNWSPILSPDGQWVLYMVSQPASGRLMRMPAAGGSAELILESKGRPDFVRSSKAPKRAHGYHLTTAGNPAFRCPTRPSMPCVLSEAVRGDVVFSSFAPAPSAKKTEVFRIALDNPNDLFWDLSEDGTRIAYGNKGNQLIRVRDLIQHSTRDIFVSSVPEVESIGWSADGKSIFATDYAPKEYSLLRITLDGKATVLYKAPEPIEVIEVSRDGRHLALGELFSETNAWLIEGIP